ncbi:hypothetical protein [Methylobacterium soli]|uniref:Uncharacterized protein n=1 Tax=Methylobacterium soli TaxID=553447 RepID=A0A6L3SNR6_9HYPH|nr:hypothetical protein [Methylobacterium soli]KAB1069995.1 hypothetical protein F6X53_30625 [Methylobacterium soli]GJE45486.1 hypothetical protein AEGHOMDF_4682 [Methylobacterium soli]
MRRPARDFAVRIDFGGQETVVEACTERGLCLLAEAFFRELYARPCKVTYTIECQDDGAGRRIAAYLGDVWLELLGTP